MKLLITLLFSITLLSHQLLSQISNCFQITSILVDACAPTGQEGLNEMVSFQVGPAPLNVANMSVTWATTTIPWLGTCQNATTAQKVAQLNETIEACGWLLEPVNGILPANSKVILVTSVDMNVASNSFAGLTDTTYMLFHCGSVTQGHFANFNSSGGTRTLSMSFSSPAGCSSSVSYQLNQLVNQNGQPGAQDGATVLFDAQGNATYINNGCNAPFIPLSAAWTPPFNGNVCANSPPINLNSLVTGNSGGTWSGEGVIGGNFFFVEGLSGAVEVTYTVTQGSCSTSQTQTINIIQLPDPTFNNPGPICANASPINLNGLVTGTPGGSFSGQGVVNNMLNPFGLSGSVGITYTVVVSGCLSNSTEIFTIIPADNASWNIPTGVCSGEIIDLNELVTGAQGGTWSGQGVNGNIWNTSGLSGTIALTYTVSNNDCESVVTQNVTLNQGGDPSWALTQNICSADGLQDFNAFVTGTAGGTWSGQGINAQGIFNPAIVAGLVTITYTIGSGNCQSQQSVSFDVATSPEPPTVIGPVSYCQGEDAAPLIALGEQDAIFIWFDDENLTELLSEDFSYQPQTESSNTIYVIQKANGCFSLPTIVNMEITPKPEDPQVPSEVFACPGQSVNITAIGQGTIGWYDDPQLNDLLAAGSSFSFPAGAYSILYVVQTIDNCLSAPSIITISEGTLIEAVINPTGPIELCEGESITLSSNFESGNNWTGGSTANTINVSQAGQYVLTVEGACNSSSDTVTVIQIELNAAFAASATSGEAPLTVTFTPESVAGQVCDWFINEQAEQALSTGSFTFTQPGTYQVKRVCSINDCQDEFTVEITVTSGELVLEISNSFTPNGDSFNDFFKPNISGAKDLNAKIFNRWGQLIFEFQGLDQSWNGDINGSPAPEGVYFFIVEVQDFSGKQIVKNGSLTLLR